MIRSSIRQHAIRQAIRSFASVGSVVSPTTQILGRNANTTRGALTLLPTAQKQQQQQQRRSFLFDAFSSKNPILELTTTNPTETADFTSVTPKQLIKATTQVGEDYNQAATNFSVNDNPDTLAKEILEKLQKLEEGPQTLRNLAVLLYQMHLFDKSWIDATKQVPLQFAHQESLDVLKALKRAATGSENDEMMERVLELQIGEYKKRGVELEEEDRETWDVLANASVQLEARFLTMEDPAKAKSNQSGTKEQLQDLYTLLSVKQKQAELLGYKDYVDMSLDGRMMEQREDIEPLLDEVAARAQIAMDKAEEDKATYVPTADVTPYLSLDGTLQGLFALCRALFGIVVSEDNNGAKAWHPDVRLFHVVDEETEEALGSFYLDPFKRPIKTKTTFMGAMTKDTVYMNTNVQPPVWDDMATPVQLKDVVSIFHEFGHVLQFLLARDDARFGLEDSHATMDVSEIVPHFMEHWVFEESILQTMAHFSGTTIPDDVIQEAQVHRQHSKVDESLRRVFLGRLEFELFSPNTRPDGESLVAMQRRLSERYVAHDVLPKSDLSPMAQLVEANGTKPVAQYRYLLSELISSDIFVAFQDAGFSNQEAMQKLGRQFKEVLLTPGVAVNGRGALKALRNKDAVSTEAFFSLYKL